MVFSTFSTVFIAELGGQKPSWRHCSSRLSPDRPGLCFSEPPWPWFAPAWSASFWVSGWPARFHQSDWKTMAGLLMVALGLWLGAQAIQTLLLETTGA